MSQKDFNFKRDIVKTISIDYLLYLPNEYAKLNNKWPLILFLHGAGERGDDIELVRRNGIPKIAEQMNLQFVCISPQCPDGSYWEEQFDELNALLDYIIEKYDIDENMIYITGISMGGYGTWSFATLFPEKIAAIVPICGGGNPEYADYLKNIAIWAFHGAKDDIVPIEETQRMVDAVNIQGGNAKFTIYEDLGHDSWTVTYNNQELYNWLLINKRISE